MVGTLTAAFPLPLSGELVAPAALPGTYQVFASVSLISAGGGARLDARQIDVTVS